MLTNVRFKKKVLNKLTNYQQFVFIVWLLKSLKLFRYNFAFERLALINFCGEEY